MSFSCARCSSRHTPPRRGAGPPTPIRAATAAMNRSFSSCRSVSASPVGKYTLATVRSRGVDLEVAAVSVELVCVRSDQRPRDGVPAQHRNAVAALEMWIRRGQLPAVRPGRAPSASASCSSSALVSCRHTTSARVCSSHGSRPRFSGERSLTAARMPLTLTVLTITGPDPSWAPPKRRHAPSLQYRRYRLRVGGHGRTRAHPSSAPAEANRSHAAPVPVLAERVAHGGRSARRHRSLRGVRADDGRA